jgi:putative FmdB family regulatory protein
MILDDMICKKCGFEKEIWRKINDKPEVKCEKCGTKMIKNFINLNFSLKGQGWASKNTATASKPQRFKEVGIKVDTNKKREMEAAGEVL